MAYAWISILWLVWYRAFHQNEPPFHIDEFYLWHALTFIIGVLLAGPIAYLAKEI